MYRHRYRNEEGYPVARPRRSRHGSRERAQPSEAQIGLGTAAAFGSSPVSILLLSLANTPLPGSSILNNLFRTTLGLNIGPVISTVAGFLADYAALTYLWEAACKVFETHLMSRVYISPLDDLYRNVLNRDAVQRMMIRVRAVKAQTARGSAWEEDDGERSAASYAFDDNGHFNYSEWQAHVEPRYEPYHGSHHFWYKGYLLFFRRTQATTERDVPDDRFE